MSAGGWDERLQDRAAEDRATDPRATLAVALRMAAPSGVLGNDGALLTMDRLAERGVLLVTEADLERAIESVLPDLLTDVAYARIFAALSAEVVA